MATAAETRVLRFGEFELDVRARELRKRGVRVRLQGQPLLVLEALLHAAGDVVTREELRSQLWPADTFVDFDHSLHNAVARIREVLGDSAEKPRYIETLPRRGYRFIAAVEKPETPPSSPAIPVAPEQPAPAEPRAGGSRLLQAAAAIALVLLLAGVWLARTGGDSTHAAAHVSSIAVLPLDNLSGDPSEEFFADGMTDQLITDLAKIRSLRVISRTSVTQYKKTTKTLPEIARELHVDAIVEGSVVRSGQRVRVTAQLIEASTDQHLWADTYDRNLDDVLKLQSDVVAAIAQQVRAQLSPQQQAELRAAHSVNPAAYDDYLRGQIYFTTEYTNPASLRKAQHLFEDAIAKDPQFALAYAGLADTFVFLAFDRALSREEAYSSAQAALAKAALLDDNIGQAHDALGLLRSNFEWDWSGADREFQRAIALAPSYSCAHEDRAIFLAIQGRRAEALAEIAQMQQLDYGYSAGQSESAAYFELHDYAHLIESSRRALLAYPNDEGQHLNLGIGYESTGKLQEAIAEYQKAMELSGSLQSKIALAHVYAAAGKKAEAVGMLRRLARKAQDTPIAPYTMATIYAGLGENDKAFEFLEKAYSEKSLDLYFWLTADPVLGDLRRDPRYESIVRRMGLPNAAI